MNLQILLYLAFLSTMMDVVLIRIDYTIFHQSQNSFLCLDEILLPQLIDYHLKNIDKNKRYIIGTRGKEGISCFQCNYQKKEREKQRFTHSMFGDDFHPSRQNIDRNNNLYREKKNERKKACYFSNLYNISVIFS